MDVDISVAATCDEHIQVLRNHANELVAVCAVVWRRLDIGIDVVDAGNIGDNSSCEIQDRAVRALLG